MKIICKNQQLHDKINKYYWEVQAYEWNFNVSQKCASSRMINGKEVKIYDIHLSIQSFRLELTS